MNFKFAPKLYYPPHECNEMHKVLRKAVMAIHSVGIVVGDPSRIESHLWFIEDSLQKSERQLRFYEYERDKVK